MIDAQTSPHGIPRKLLEEKKKELSSSNQKERPPEMDKWAQEAMRRAEHARQMLYGNNDSAPAAQLGAEVQSKAVPVSPNRYDDHGEKEGEKTSNSKQSRWGRQNSGSNIPDEKHKRNSNSADDDSFSSTNSTSSYGEERRNKSKKRRKERSRS